MKSKIIARSAWGDIAAYSYRGYIIARHGWVWRVHSNLVEVAVTTLAAHGTVRQAKHSIDRLYRTEGGTL